MCFQLCIFRAGCDSRPVVKVFLSPRAVWLIWCDSKADSTVWMGEDCFSDFVRASLKTGGFMRIDDDKVYGAALELAANGMGHTRPNPMVGAVLCKRRRNHR